METILWDGGLLLAGGMAGGLPGIFLRLGFDVSFGGGGV